METIPATHFLNESEKPTGKHYIILGMSWAGWLFDFYDLMMFSFLLIPIKETLGLSDASLSLLLVRPWRRRPWAAFSSDTCPIASAERPSSPGRSSSTPSARSPAACAGRLVAAGVPCDHRPRGRRRMGDRSDVGGGDLSRQDAHRFAAVMQNGTPLGIALASVVGGFAQPALASAFGPDRGWRGCFFLSVLPALLVVVIRRFMPESDVWLEHRRLAAEPEGGHLSDLLRTPGLRRLFLLGLVLALTDMSAYWFTYSWMPKYLYDNLGFSIAHSGLWMLVAQAGGLLGYLSFGVFADWKGRRPAYTGFSLIWAVGLVAITLFWSRIAAWPWLALAFMFMVGFGTGNFSGYGPIFSEIFPTKVRNTAMGTAFNLARGVQFFTPLIITQVATRYGLGGGISLAAFFAVFTGLWVWTLPETRGTKIVAEP